MCYEVHPDSDLMTNFDKSDRHIYEEAIRRCGCKRFYIVDEAYDKCNRLLLNCNALKFKDRSSCVHNETNLCIQKFWKIVDAVREHRGCVEGLQCDKCYKCEMHVPESNIGTFAAKRNKVRAIQFTGDNYNAIMDFTKRNVKSIFCTGFGWCCEIQIDGREFILSKGYWLTCSMSITGAKENLKSEFVWERFSPEEFERIYEPY